MRDVVAEARRAERLKEPVPDAVKAEWCKEVLGQETTDPDVLMLRKCLCAVIRELWPKL